MAVSGHFCFLGRQTAYDEERRRWMGLGQFEIGRLNVGQEGGKKIKVAENWAA